MDFKTWISENLTWGWTTVRNLILLVALVAGITYLAATRGNITRALKFGVLAAVFLAILFNLDGIATLIGSLFPKSGG